MNTIFKPKTEEELGEAYHEMKRKTDEFMTKVFSNLHKDPKDPNVYRNSKGEWMFEHDLKNEYILVNYDSVWSYFYSNIICNYNIVKMLIEDWLKENTDWPQLPTINLFNIKPNMLKENTDWPQLPTFKTIKTFEDALKENTDWPQLPT